MSCATWSTAVNGSAVLMRVLARRAARDVDRQKQETRRVENNQNPPIRKSEFGFADGYSDVGRLVCPPGVGPSEDGRIDVSEWWLRTEFGPYENGAGPRWRDGSSDVRHDARGGEGRVLRGASAACSRRVESVARRATRIARITRRNKVNDQFKNCPNGNASCHAWRQLNWQRPRINREAFRKVVECAILLFPRMALGFTQGVATGWHGLHPGRVLVTLTLALPMPFSRNNDLLLN